MKIQRKTHIQKKPLTHGKHIFSRTSVVKKRRKRMGDFFILSRLSRGNATLSFGKKKQASIVNFSFRTWLIIAIAGIIGITILFFVFSPRFYVQSGNISVTRADEYVNIERALRPIDEVVSGKHIFSISSGDLLTNIRDYQPNISRLSVDVWLPSRAHIELHSYQPVFQLQQMNEYYVIVENGVLIPVSWYRDDITRVFISQVDTIALSEYEQVFSRAMMQDIQNIIDVVSQVFVDVAFQIDVFPVENEVHVLFRDSARVIFSLDTDTVVTTKLLNRVLQNQDISLSQFVYIDARILGRVYTCPITNTATCNANLDVSYPNRNLYQVVIDPETSE